MNKFKKKITIFLAISVSLLKSTSYRVICKTSTITLQVSDFVKNFQEKNIPVYKTADNLLVNQKLDYISSNGYLLKDDESALSVPNELKEKITLHPVLKYINDRDYYFNFRTSNEPRVGDIEDKFLYVQTNQGRPLGMVYFDTVKNVVEIAYDVSPLLGCGIINRFGDALPKAPKPDRILLRNLITRLMKQAKELEEIDAQKENEMNYLKTN